jgi:hypothetical protein
LRENSHDIIEGKRSAKKKSAKIIFSSTTMSANLEKEELKASLARIATPKAMVTKMYDAATGKFGKSNVKVISVDSERLESFKFSDAWVRDVDI